MAARCRAINPEIDAVAVAAFLTVGNMEALLDQGFDLVVDALRQLSGQGRNHRLVPPPQAAVDHCGRGRRARRSHPGPGARCFAHRARRDAGADSQKLRGEFNFPKNPQRYFGVPAVYSLENVKYPQADGSVCGLRPALGADAALKLDCGAGLGAATHITGAFAFAAVAKALEMLLKPRRAQAPVAAAETVEAD